MPVAAGFIEIAGGIAADRHLDGGVDISGRQPVTRSLRAIDIDLDGELAERREHRQIGNPLYGGEHILDLVGGVCDRLEIVTKQLDPVFTLTPRYGVGYVIL